MKPALMAVILIAPLFAQVEDRSTETRTFAGVREVVLDNVSGSVEVSGYNGRDVVMEIEKRIRAESDERMDAARREVKLEATESAGRLKLLVDGPFRCDCGSWGLRRNGYHVTYDFKLRIPVDAAFDVRTVNGPVTMEGIAGAGKATTVNGGVRVVFAKNPPGPVTLETINGSVDVTLRPGLSADLRMKTMNGGMYTDFEVKPLPAEAATTERRNGKFVYRTQDAARVRAGAGGPELSLKTLNGDIYVRSGIK
jgi:hypothetical protein